MVFEYRARPFELEDRWGNLIDYGVVDGDTYDMQIDQGFYDWKVERIRPYNVDTHEISFVSHDTEEYERGIEEAEWVLQWMREAVREWDKNRWPLEIVVEEYDHRGTYNRVLAWVERKIDGEVLNERLLEEFDDIEY